MQPGDHVFCKRNNKNIWKGSGIVIGKENNFKIVYQSPVLQSWNEALVLSRAGKSTSRNRTWLNIKNLGDDSHQSFDFSIIKAWKNVEHKALV